jgi:polyhydroxyalkanoate synthesis regulator protein
MQPQPEPILVKRYARSRLYDTAALRYVTVGDLRDWLARGVPFVVRDRETGDDITAVLLASPGSSSLT